MKVRISIFICLVVSIFVGHSQQLKKKSSEKIKIACVGNSITYGYGVANRENNAYPKQLQRLLGNKYQVENFGVSGNTLLKKGDYPYWNSKEYQKALSFSPDILFVKLGTNDSKLQNRIYLDTDFVKDYKELIASFKEKNSSVKVVLLLPVPSFLKDSNSIWDPVIKNKIIPLTQNVAYDTKSELIDLYQLFVGESALLPDGVHPSSLGATKIARRLYESVVMKSNNKFSLFDKLKIKDSKKTKFHGFEQHDFVFKGVNCKVVIPKKTRKGKPWVWRARFWGHEPQTDIALLERGFHIVYCDVSDLFGGPKAVKRWNSFYKLIRKAGLSKKVVLEGMSRGGLIIYNWAAENPEKVACVYADAPVLDGNSWPGGFGESKGYASGWDKLKREYNLDSKEAIENFDGSPIDKIKKIANASFPMYHVCGAADKVVPVDENTRIFEKGIKANGGTITVVYKDGIGHHPHSLKNPTPIVDFILRATSYKYNFAAIPSPGSEYRSAAGWIKGKGWWYQMEDIDSLSRNSGKLDLLLIGNSITQGWGGNRTLTTYKPGQNAANTHFKNLNWVSAGISGDRTEHIAWRVNNGSYEKGDPTFVTLAIGVNNFSFNSAEEIVEGIKMDILAIRKKLPNAKILFFGPLPTGLKKDSNQRIKYKKIHKVIKRFGRKKHVFYYDMENIFSTKKGDLNPLYYGGDGIHLKPKGYDIWGAFIINEIQKLKK